MIMTGQAERLMSLMAERPRTILICSCEDTMPLDGEGIRRACRDIRGHRRPSILPCGARALSQSSCERRTRHGRVHPGSTFVQRNCRRNTRRHPAYVREYPRAGGLVERCGQSRTKNGRSHCRKRRTRYGCSFCVAGKRRRCAALWERRTHNRSRAPAEGPTRHNRADQAGRRDCTATRDGVSHRARRYP